MNSIFRIFININLLLLLNLTVLSFFAYSKTIRENKNYDVLHYKIFLNVDMDKQYIKGRIETKIIYTIKSDTLVFDSENLNISNIKVNNIVLNFITVKNKLKIDTKGNFEEGDTLLVTIEYDGNPKHGKGIYFFKPSPANPRIKYQCYSQGEEEWNHFWFPCYDYPDDRMTSEMIITVNKRFKAISNGNLLSIKDNQDSTRTFHWLLNKEHVTYLVSFVIGEFEEIKDKYNNIPLSYYVYKEKIENAQLNFPKTKEMLKYFENKLAFKYPWNNYSQIILQDFFGGMENTTLTNLIDDIPDRKHYKYDESYSHFYEMIMAHELIHQWFGDFITCKKWEDLWLNEGFAEFMTGMYKGAMYGESEKKLYFYDEMENYRNINSKESMPTVSLKSNNVYPKGALILNMLKSLTGEKVFWNIINTYLNRYKNQSIETSDFKKIVDEISGNDYSWFFNQWLFKAGHPIFNVDSKYDEKKQELTLNFVQKQKIDSTRPVFKTPLEIAIFSGNKFEKKKITIDSIKNTFLFKNINKSPDFISIDPERNIIKEIIYDRPKNELIAQLMKSDNEIDKMEAATQLGKFNNEPDIFSALKNSFFKEKCWKVRQNIISSLIKAKNKELNVLLMDCVKTEKNPFVKKEILNGLSTFKNDENISRLLFRSIYDSSLSVVITAIQTMTAYDSLKAFDTLVKLLDVESFRNQIQEYTLGAMVKSKDARAIPYFMEYLNKGYSSLARNSAFLGLYNLSRTHSELYDFFIDNLKSENSYFRRMSVNALVNIGDKRAIKYIEDLDKTEKIEFIRNVIKDALKKLK